MKLHRFYVKDEPLVSSLHLKEKGIVHQFTKVLRYKPGQQAVLFDGKSLERLYEIDEIKRDFINLKYIKDLERLTPKRNVYVIWSLLKKDKNEWVLQKCTELGVSHFLPVIADRSEKTGFNLERANKIVVEAAEQCGRSDIPSVREPIMVSAAVLELKNNVKLYVAEQYSEQSSQHAVDGSQLQNPAGVLIGPEGGWSDEEKKLFAEIGIKHMNLHDFTLRAETAAIIAAGKLVQ